MAKFTAYKISTKKAGMKRDGFKSQMGFFTPVYSGLAEQFAQPRQFLFLGACGRCRGKRPSELQAYLRWHRLVGRGSIAPILKWGIAMEILRDALSSSRNK